MSSLGVAVEQKPPKENDIIELIESFMSDHSDQNFVSIGDVMDLCLDVRLLLSNN
jgi:hypothetical protein